jgi:hypothetical protein
VWEHLAFVVGLSEQVEVCILVGGLEHLLFSPIVGMMIQSDELIFFRGVGLNHQSV